MRLFFTAIALYCCAQSTHADVIDNVPQHPDPERQYVIYLHGRIIEDGDVRPVHPVWGVYDYPAVLKALDATQRTVISRQRPAGTQVQAYAETVTAQIQALLKAGVPAQQITVIGFSKGGAIALAASHLNTHPEVGFVLLATCGSWLEQQSQLHLSGRVLSIYETSDDLAGSCKRVAERDPMPESFTEYVISTGKQHGAFYQPLPDWLQPLRAWLTDNTFSD